MAWKEGQELCWWCLIAVLWFFAVVGTFLIADLHGQRIGEMFALVSYPAAIIVSFVGGFRLDKIYHERDVLK